MFLTVGGIQYQPAEAHLLYDLALGGFGGSDQEKIFVWTAPDGDYTINFSASESSMSLAKYATYASEVTPVPEPSTCVLLGIASVVVLCMVRRRPSAVGMGRANL